MEDLSHQVLRQAAEAGISMDEVAAAIAEDIHQEEQQRYAEALSRPARRNETATTTDTTGGTMNDPQTARAPDNVTLGAGAFTARPFGPLQAALDRLAEEHAERAGARRIWDPPTPQTNQEPNAATRRTLEEILRTHSPFSIPRAGDSITVEDFLRHRHVQGMDFDGDADSFSFEQWMERDKREREKALDDLVTECDEWSKGDLVSGNSLDVVELPEFKTFREFLSEAIIAFCTEKRDRVLNYSSPSGRYGDYELSLFMEKNEVVCESNTVDITNVCLKIFDKGLIDRIRILTYMMGRSANSAGVWLFGIKLGVVLRTAEAFFSVIYDSSKGKECACINIKGLMLSGSILCLTAGTKYEAVLYRALRTVLEKARKLYVQAQVMDLVMRELFEGRQSLIDRDLIQRNNEIPEPKEDSFIKQELENFKLED